MHPKTSWIPFRNVRHTPNLENIKRNSNKFNITTYQPTLLTCWNIFIISLFLPVFNAIIMYILSFSWIPTFQQFKFWPPFPYFQHSVHTKLLLTKANTLLHQCIKAQTGPVPKKAFPWKTTASYDIMDPFHKHQAYPKSWKYQIKCLNIWSYHLSPLMPQTLK